VGDGEKLLTHLNSALKVLLGLDIFPRVPKKKLNFVDQCYGRSSILRTFETHPPDRGSQGPEGAAARNSNRKILFTIWRPTGKTGVNLNSFLSTPDGGVWSISPAIRSTPEK